MHEHRIVGTYRSVAIEVAAWDAVGAEVDLSCAGMFTHEVGGAPLVGGLLDLDRALGGRLQQLRAENVFRAQEMETLILKKLPSEIAADAILVIGMGDPERWTPHLMERATRVGVREAIRLGATTAGIAPGLLDSGLKGGETAEAPAAMLRGVTSAIDAELRLAELGLAPRPAFEKWTFGTGAAHLDDATVKFRQALAAATA